MAKLPLPFVVLASGRGSNARALLEAARQRPELLRAVAVVSDRANAPVLGLAREFGICAQVIEGGDPALMRDFLAASGARWACLAGYKRLLGSGVLDLFADAELGHRVLNVHPSLLPAFPGLHGYRRAYAEGVKVSGVTVHLVDTGLDTGPVVLQRSFEREEGDTLEDFEARGRALELELFPRALLLAAEGRLRLQREAGARWVSLNG